MRGVASLARSSSPPTASLHARRYAQATAAEEDAADATADAAPPTPRSSPDEEARPTRMRHGLSVRLAAD